MPKGVASQRYTGEFKQKVVETMLQDKLGYLETAELFGLRHKRVQDWERIYLEEGTEGLYVERRGRPHGTGKDKPRKLDNQVEEDLIAEVQRLRAENAYLKNLQALVLEDERHQHKKRR